MAGRTRAQDAHTRIWVPYSEGELMGVHRPVTAELLLLQKRIAWSARQMLKSVEAMLMPLPRATCP